MNRTTEFRLIMLGIGILCGLAAASAVWPVIDVVMTVGLLGVLGLLVAGYLGRELVRELRFRRDMRALDRLDATRAAALVGRTG
jgi:hypothetical protein